MSVRRTIKNAEPEPQEDIEAVRERLRRRIARFLGEDEGTYDPRTASGETLASPPVFRDERPDLEEIGRKIREARAERDAAPPPVKISVL